MSELSDLSDRVKALELLAARRKNPAFQILNLLGGAILAGLLACNLWLIRQNKLEAAQSATEHLFWVLGHEAYPAQDRARAFTELLLAGNKEWRGAHADDLNLERINLSNVELEGADLSGTILSRGAFAGVKFHKCRLQQTDFADADMTGADLSGSDLLRAVLKRTELRQANLRGTSLEQVEAQNVSLVSAHLTDAYMLMANLTDANLSAADFGGANLEAAIFKGANLALARFTGVNLRDTDFTDCNWWRARGFTTDQLAMLGKKFAPTEASPKALREDYDLWLKSSKEVK